MTNNQTQLFNIVSHYGNQLPEKVMSFQQAVDILENENDALEGSWHYQIRKTEPVHFYIDIDEKHEYDINTLLSHIRDYFGLENEDLKTTRNSAKDFSFHIDIPKRYGLIDDIHSHIKQIVKKYNWNPEQYDTSVYCKRPYRMPFQAKPASNGKPFAKNAKHIITNGNTIDFILNYIPEDSIKLESLAPEVEPVKKTKKQSPTNNKTSTTTKANPNLAKIIECLSVERATDHKTWLDVGFGLKNIETSDDENLKLFVDFSKKMIGADPEWQLASKYCGLPKKDNGIDFKRLQEWAKQDNPTLYQQYFPSKCLIDDENYLNDEEPYLFTEWEKTHCKILNPPSYMEHKITQDEDRFILRTTKALEQSYSHMSISVNSLDKKGKSVAKKTSFINTWTKLNDKIKLYDEVGVYPYPLNCPTNIYNCWASFRGDLLPETSKSFDTELNTFKQLISVLCGHEEIASDYLLKWIAQSIQYPALKTTVPTIISKQGAGKGTLVKLLTALLGNTKVLSTTNADVVFGKFNNQMLDAYLVNLDELSPKDVKDVEHKIKGLITEPTISIDVKGVSSFTIKSYHRFINTTNNEFGVFKTEIGDRRNFIVRASDELIGNKHFFTNFNNNIINNTEVVKYIYNYLKSIPDLERFHEAGNIPATEYGNALKQASRSDYDLWLESFTKENSTSGNNTFTSSFLYQDFIKFVKKDCYKAQAFGIRILNIVSGAITKGKHSRDGESKVFNWNILEKHYKTKCLIDEDNYDEDDELSNASTTEGTYSIDGILQAD